MVQVVGRAMLQLALGVCPAGEELWAPEEEGYLFLILTMVPILYALNRLYL